MENHFHLVLETPQANLVAGMKWFLGTYTGRFNRRHKLFGHLFSGRYKSLIVDGNGTGYLKTVCDYVHLNPVRANLIAKEQPLSEYRWSSYPEYLKAPSKRPTWLRVDRLFGEWRIPIDSEAGRRQFEEQMEQRRADDEDPQIKTMQRRWCCGSEQFRSELLAQMAERVGESHYGAERRESGQEKANRMIDEELKKVEWTEEDLKGRQKGDAVKVRIARKLRAETTMTLKWIAARLSMGKWTHVSNLIHVVRPDKNQLLTKEWQ